MTVAIIDYDAGNTCSVSFALQRLGIEPVLTDDPAILAAADKVIFPGVGEASSAMKYLRYKNLCPVIKDLRQPVLGICLGMQLMCSHTAENDSIGLGIFDCAVRKFDPLLKVPHIGWNTVEPSPSTLFPIPPANSFFYFVHSYYAEICPHTIAVTTYGIPFSACLQKGNFYAVQFHPEKSAEPGQQVLQNFLNI
jgi:glutamine amidotransferase